MQRNWPSNGRNSQPASDGRRTDGPLSRRDEAPICFPLNIATADLIDAHGGQLQSCDLAFRLHGKRLNFHGPLRTIKTFEDNALAKRLLAEPGGGAVLVIDGGGSLHTASAPSTSRSISAGWISRQGHGCIVTRMASSSAPGGCTAFNLNEN
jgi:regulator of ribonuclease activity A